MKKAKSRVVHIACVQTPDGGIGYQGQLLYHLKHDLKRFRQLTLNQIVLMGRKTFESIGHPLNCRINLVLSKSGWHPKEAFDHLCVFDTLSKAMSFAQEKYPKKTIFVIGGQALYEDTLKQADALYLTLVKGDKKADVFYPLEAATRAFKLFYQCDDLMHYVSKSCETVY